MRKLGLALVLAAGLSSSLLAGPDEARQLFWRNKVLEAELPLAKSEAVYFVINADEGRILFKARGVVLREWKISGLRGRLPAWPVVSTSLLKKEAQTAPKRKLIDPKNPGTAEEIGSYELETLESKDMPAEYVLTFENGIMIDVTSGRMTAAGLLAGWKLSLDKAIYERARDIWWLAFKPGNRMFKVRFDDPQDAKTLCWSLLSGMSGIIVFNLS
jgi:hypothetical protein